MFDETKTLSRQTKHLRPDRRSSFLGLSPSGFHEVAYVEWGRPEDPCPVVCIHGITRQARDFNYLAAELAASGRRGSSEWLRNPEDYSLPQYCSDMNTLLARLSVQHVDWVGTSLGGLIGVAMAGFSNTIVHRLVVNDIGPYVSSLGLLRIGRYIADMPRVFGTIEEGERYFRTVLAPYGYLADEHWRHLTVHSLQRDTETGRYAVRCDPSVGKALKTPWFLSSLNLWKYWEAIEALTLVLHGAKSDLLTNELTVEMCKRNRRSAVVRFDDCGHVPPLVAPNQIDVITEFLK